MLLGTLDVKNPKGVHGRVAKEIARIAGQYDAVIKILYNEEVADAISILEVLSLGIPFGSSFSVKVQGKHADKALEDLTLLFEREDDP